MTYLRNSRMTGYWFEGRVQRFVPTAAAPTVAAAAASTVVAAAAVAPTVVPPVAPTY